MMNIGDFVKDNPFTIADIDLRENIKQTISRQVLPSALVGDYGTVVGFYLDSFKVKSWKSIPDNIIDIIDETIEDMGYKLTMPTYKKYDTSSREYDGIFAFVTCYNKNKEKISLNDYKNFFSSNYITAPTANEIAASVNEAIERQLENCLKNSVIKSKSKVNFKVKYILTDKNKEYAKKVGEYLHKNIKDKLEKNGFVSCLAKYEDSTHIYNDEILVEGYFIIR